MKEDESLSKARNLDLRNSLIALRRAAEMAREIAIRTNTAIIVSRDGEIARVTADELRAEGK